MATGSCSALSPIDPWVTDSLTHTLRATGELDMIHPNPVGYRAGQELSAGGRTGRDTVAR